MACYDTVCNVIVCYAMVCYVEGGLPVRLLGVGGEEGVVDEPWSRTNGVNTNGVAAKATIFDRFGKKVRKMSTDVDRL